MDQIELIEYEFGGRALRMTGGVAYKMYASLVDAH